MVLRLLQITTCSYGMMLLIFPGAINDINIWERSPLFESFQDGSFTKLDFEYYINGELFDELFLLIDGIYPQLSRFLQTIPVPITKINCNFSGWQEAQRKDVERAFGLLKKKFHFLVNSIQMHHREGIFYAVWACIAMYNIMVEIFVEEHQEESSTFYEVVTQEDQETSVEVVEVADHERAVRKVDAEDTDFEENEEYADLKNHIVDLDSKRRRENATFMCGKLRIVQRRRHNFYNFGAHCQLKNAVKKDLYRKKHRDADDGDEMDDFDPSE